jgi:hypothetical protein
MGCVIPVAPPDLAALCAIAAKNAKEVGSVAIAYWSC